MTAPVLTLSDVVLRRGERTVLDVRELRVAPGETVALLGPNGAGKTTLLHVAALLTRPDAGTVTIAGELATPENAAQLRRMLSVVFQDPLLFDVSVLANAAAALQFAGVARSPAESQARDWLERFGVGHLAGRRARTISGGEASRVALARAFASTPAVLLLDEPFSPLDPPTRATLLPILRERLQETGTAAVLVTHDLDEAFAFGDRLVLIRAGCILASGPAPALIAHPPTPEIAALLGIETILSATVKRLVGGCVSLSLDPASPLVEVQALSELALSPGQAVTMTLPMGATRALHPPDDAPPGWNLLPGTVTAVTALSSGTRLVVATPAPIVALARWHGAEPRWRPGDRAVVAFPPDAAHLIDENG